MALLTTSDEADAIFCGALGNAARPPMADIRGARAAHARSA